MSKVITIEPLDVIYGPSEYKWVMKVDERLHGWHIRRVHVF